MSPRQFISCLLSLLLTLTAHAQRPGAPSGAGNGVIGIVVDADSNEPLEYATVALLNAMDSALITGLVTNASGEFRLRAKQGDYWVKIDFIGYQTKWIENVSISQGMPVQLGIIELQVDANLLEEVKVIGERSTVTFELDKKVFTVGKDIAHTGNDATEVLDNIPSVSVDIEGNISLRGSSGVRILIDGKESGISPLTRLRSIPAGSVEKVEVITNPSARYDAEGMTGIINVILKKDEQKGFNASLNASTGVPASQGTSVNLNFRRDRVNWFGNIGGYYRKRPGSGDLYSNRYASSLPITTLDRNFDRGGLSGNVRAGLDYFITDKAQLTGSFNFGLGDENNNSELDYRFYDAAENLVSASFREEDEEENERQQAYELNFNKQYASRKHTLKATVQWEEDSEDENSDLLTRDYNLPELSLDNATAFSERSRNDEGQDELLLQTDFVKPFGENGKIELGGKGTFRNIVNDYLVEEFVNSNWQPLDDLSNVFEYDENITALYAQYGNKIGKLGYQMGVRSENTDIVTLLRATDEENERSYFRLFPSAFLSYEVGENNALQLSYSYRMRRPRFWHLNPFFTYSDSQNRFSGNPNLDPEFTHAVEFGLLQQFKSITLNSSVYYRNTIDVIQRISTLIDTDITLTQPVNLGKQNSYGAEFIFTGDISNNLRADLSANFYSFNTKGNESNNDLDAEGFSWMSRLSTRYRINSEFDTQLRAFYRAPSNTTQGRREGILSADFSASKDVLKGKGTVTLSIRDLFNSRKRVFEQDTPEFFRSGEFQWRSRLARLGFNYRINQKKQRQRENRNGGVEGESGGEY